LNVGRGDTVHVTLTASDTVHGFHLDGYDIDERVDPGLSKEFAFEADQTGKFKYRCSVACGPLHPFMIGELVVGPNEPLLRAIGLLLVITVATLVGVGKRVVA
jgi:heme/copper-type cytochrome/quinol oxidase subunit 2